MKTILNIIFSVVLGLHLLMILVAAWHTWTGENSAVRLAGLDLASTLTTAVLVIVGIISGNSLFLDVAIVTALLGYLATVTIAKFISDQKVF
jgi:multisubunit Na+/H+ antiporter MnhF subunit